MKVRNGFISNSSSSSFILFKNYLTDEQIDHIRNWKTFCLSDEYKEILEEYAKTHKIDPHITEWQVNIDDPKIPVEPFSELDFPYNPNAEISDWEIEETGDIFNISTIIDNYNMRQFLESIGIDIDKCGIVNRDGHAEVFGLNDFKTDMRDYLDDPGYFDNYNEKYYLTSKDYRERFYPNWSSDNDLDKPLKKKKWICEDAGRAINEFEKKFNDFALESGYFKWLDSEEFSFNYQEKVPGIEIFRKVFKLIEEVRNNWQAVDDYETENLPEIQQEDQLVTAAIEKEGYFNKEEEKAYNEALNKLYKPIGINIADSIKNQ